MKLLKTIFTPLSWLVYLCIGAYLLISAPVLLGCRPVVVLSGSMEPAFPVGSIIYYKPAPFEEIKEGDAITFSTETGALVTHRVVEKNEISASFVTKGDANETEDLNELSYDRVEGKVWGPCIPKAGYLISAGKKPAAIGVMAGVIIINIALDFAAPDKKKKEKED